MALTAEQKQLLHIMGLSIQGKTLNRLSDAEPVQWEVLLREAQQQGVLLGLLEALAPVQHTIEDALRKAYWKKAYLSYLSGARVRKSQAQLVDVLEEAGCPYVILKGEASATYYPKADARQMGDVDFIVPTQWMQIVAEKMGPLGYAHIPGVSAHHHLLKGQNTRLEMHKELAGMPQGKTRQTLQDYLADLYERSVCKQIEGQHFQAPCDAHHAMVLLLHMKHHMTEQGMGLRHMIDWACFVNATAEKPFWQEELLPLLEKIGLKRFAAALTKTVSIYLQSVCPSWAAQIEEDLCRDIMEDIMTGGNFGRKNAERARSAHMLPDWEHVEKDGKLLLLYRALRTSVLQQYPQVKDRPAALFFKMVWKVLRYVVLFLQGKRPNLVKAAGYVEQRKSLYHRLKMYKTDQ